MNRRDNQLGEVVLRSNMKTLSFSSTIFEKRRCRETMTKQQNRGTGICNRVMEEDTTASSPSRRSLLYKWTGKKVSTERRHYLTRCAEKSQCNLNHLDQEQDIPCYSSTSCFSDSSSRGFSSSDTKPVYKMRSRSSCLAPLMSKPMRTSLSSVSERSEKVNRRQSNLFSEQKKLYPIREIHRRHRSEHTSKYDEGFNQSWKMGSNRKNAMQPVSPGAQLKSFLSSLFTAGSTKKKIASFNGGCEDENIERKIYSAKVSTSTVSSTSSFSRPCLSKHSPATRDNLRNRGKRSVQFYPVSVILNEDCRPSGHKRSHREEDHPNLLSVPVSTSRKIGWSPTRKKEDLKLHVVENRRRVEQAAKDFLKEYHQNQKKQNALNFRNWLVHTEAEDEDAASCSSSDLFELDHLKVTGNHRYSEELPVYETTHVSTNSAISKGLMV